MKTSKYIGLISVYYYAILMQAFLKEPSDVEVSDDSESISLLQNLLIYLLNHICLTPRTTQASAVAYRLIIENRKPLPRWTIRSEATAACAPSSTVTTIPPVLALALA